MRIKTTVPPPIYITTFLSTSEPSPFEALLKGVPDSQRSLEVDRERQTNAAISSLRGPN